MSSNGRAFLAVSAVLLGVAPAALAAEARDTAAGARPTFYRDVLPVLQEHCQDCHRPAGNTNSGMVAPMSLTTFDEARPWAKSIAKMASTREMPPWYASPEFHGVFEGERVLTETQVATLVEWAKTGAEPGDPATAPPPTSSRRTRAGPWASPISSSTCRSRTGSPTRSRTCSPRSRWS